MVDSSTDASPALTSITCATDASLLIVLIEGMTRGHAQSLSRLYQLTVKPLFSIAHNISRSRMDAEEIICDTFLYAWQNAHRYNTARGSVMAWLTIIVRHRSIDLVRKRRDHSSVDDIYAEVRIADLACDAKKPDEVVAQIQANNLVARVLTELPLLRRRLVELAFFEQLTHREISVVMGLPAGTVKSHIRRALCKIGVAVNSNTPLADFDLTG